MAEFHQNLRALRTSKKLTQLAVAKAIDSGHSTYTQYELGIREPNIKTIIKLAKFYEVSIDEIFGVETVVDEFTALVKCLDEKDKAEVTGVIKQMLKADKYNKEENK